MPEPMTPHEKECAYAALALCIERCKRLGDRAGLREYQAWLRDIERRPLLLENTEHVAS